MTSQTLAKGATTILALGLLLTGCATKKQMEATNLKLDGMSSQLDLLIENTRRDTLSQIFGSQTEEIVAKIDELDPAEREDFEAFVADYQKGAATVDEVRSGMVTLLGGGEREVASARGVWLRDESGEKLEAVSRGTELVDCRKLGEGELPGPITEKESLAALDWGVGQLDGQTVIFPWEYTMSSFTKEIVENTARRTAEEMRRMAGEGELSRPIYIQVTTDPATEGLKIAYPAEESEIYLNKEGSSQGGEGGGE